MAACGRRKHNRTSSAIPVQTDATSRKKDPRSLAFMVPCDFRDRPVNISKASHTAYETKNIVSKTLLVRNGKGCKFAPCPRLYQRHFAQGPERTCPSGTTDARIETASCNKPKRRLSGLGLSGIGDRDRAYDFTKAGFARLVP